MITTKDDLANWFERGLKEKATHMIIVCDTFDNSDYPVFVSPEENVKEIHDRNHNPGAMSRVMEVYNLSMDMNEQLSQYRVFNW